MTKYPVLELFHSVQGEGWHSGLGATFIRLGGCNLRCSWCDTPMALTTEGAEWLTAEEVVLRIRPLQPLVVITGGEPALHDLGPLVQVLKLYDVTVAIETNGTQPIPADWGLDWVTASPKPDSGYVLKCRADELKYVVDERLEAADIRIGAVPAGRIFLQPESGRADSAARAVRLVMNNPDWKLRVGVQLHKVLQVP